MRHGPLILAILLVAAAPVNGGDLLSTDRSVHEAIDHYVNARLQSTNTQPAPLAADATLLRRTMLDLVGRIPTAHEARQYVSSSDPEKRVQLVEQLLNDPLYLTQQVEEFNSLLMFGTGSDLRGYLTDAIGENRPWNVMFREMLLGDPQDKEQRGAIQFIKSRLRDTDLLTNEASVLFFGINISCAKCHDHPLVAEWSQDHFYGMKSFFNRTFENGGFVGEREYGLVSFKTTSGNERQAKLMFLSGDAVTEPASSEPTEEEKKAEKSRLEKYKKKKQPPPPPKYSRRQRLVDIALHEDGGNYLSRNIVNRLWERFFGRGLVMPLDQMHAENEPSHPELLDWLARDFVAHGYDLQRLIRGIVLSDSYARSSRWDGDSVPSADLFAVAQVRPLTPSQYATSLKLANLRPNYFDDTQKPEDIAKRILDAQNSARGIASRLEQPRGDFRISVDEALLFSNSAQFDRDILRNGGDTLIGHLAVIEDNESLVTQAIWNIFTRPPEEEEVAALVAFLEARNENRDEAIRQLAWALLSSSECRFNY